LLTNLASYSVKSYEQIVGQGDADDFGRFAGGAEAPLEGDEVRFMAAHNAGSDEPDFPHRGAAAADRALALLLARVHWPVGLRLLF
jgi:hypothetical protein